MSGRIPEWLPHGTRAGVCFSIDDVHPGKSADAYEAGGDLDHGVLGHVRWLLDRHPNLHVTLFTTAEWRELSPVPTRRLLARVPYLRDRVYLGGLLPAGAMRLSRHPQFVKFLSQLPRTEVGTHGLHHVRRGTSVPVEFQGLDGAVCRRLLQQMLMIFDEAGLEYAPGMAPPGWELSDDLANAMVEVGLKFVASARDIRTAVSPDATTNMSGMKGVSLIFPELIVGGHLLHITSNFQATSTIERAIQIIENGGLLAIKAHAVKNALGHIALDGLDELYRNYLDLIFTTLESKYGDSLWWTTMGQIAGRCMNGDETLRATGANS